MADAPWEQFEHLNELVYVSDMDTYELVYLNQYAEKAFSKVIKGSYKGEKCYRLLQGLTRPCPFCTNAKLREAEFFEWSYRNPLLKHTFMLKDTMLRHQGRKYRMELAIDLDRIGGETGETNAFIHYETFINQCLMEAHSIADPDQSLTSMLRCMCEKLGCSGVYIYELRGREWLYNTYGWSGEGTSVHRAPINMQETHYIQEWYETFEHNEPLVLWDLEQLRRNDRALYHYFKDAPFQRMVLAPLVSEKRVIGVLQMDNPPTQWMQEISYVSQVMSHFIIVVIQRRNLVEHLKQLSYHDQMTGAMNRHALNEYVDSEHFQKSIGLFYCDVIGLKNVNDLLGHASGDRLIVQVYQLLASLFPPNTIYRMGGDEFLITCEDLTEIEFEKLEGQLRQKVADENCGLSIGSAWSPKGSRDFATLLKNADDRMYEEKRTYYAQMDPGTGQPRREQRQEWELEPGCLQDEESPERTFLKNYLFDAESFLQSIAMPDTNYYLYCGDVQKNIYFISDNLRDDFNFSDNLVYDFVTRLEQRIYEPDRQKHQEDAQEMFREKRTLHSIRYRIYNKDGELVWIHCRGILKWNQDQTKPLFFSGSMVSLKNELEVNSVTGLLNISFAQNELADLCDSGESLLILCFTLPNFADINATFGRNTGDSILREIGCQIELELGQDFRFYSLDSTHFLATSLSVMDAEMPAQTIHRIVQQVYRSHGIHVMYPCAVGALHAPQDGSDAQELINNAQVVLQTAKAFPELDYLEFSPRMSESYKDQTDISMALNYSVNHDFEGFRIVVQPQVLAENGRVYGGEALLRWENQWKSVPPSKFVPILEQSGLIVPVGKWLVTEVIRECQTLIRDDPDFKMSFNVSYLQIMDSSFFPFLEETMKRYQVPGKNLLIELTETHFDEMPDHLEQFVQQCKSVGITFALDDFGSAYSSLQLLLQYPADVIKLDRDLMREITSSSDKLDFMMSVIYACHRFGKKVCVEGVETQEELQMVRQTECDYIQGFYFARPLELDDLHHMLAEQRQEQS